MESRLALTHLEVEGDLKTGEKKKRAGSLFLRSFFGSLPPHRLFVVFVLSLLYLFYVGKTTTCSLRDKYFYESWKDFSQFVMCCDFLLTPSGTRAFLGRDGSS